MKDPQPINLKPDDYFREQGWAALARDADGHAITTCRRDGHEGDFKDWLAECFDNGLTVVNLSPQT